jgi:hypothetical protein
LKVPDIPVQIRVECDVYPSEDPEKVGRAVRNVVSNCTPEFIDGKIRAVTERLDAMSKMYEQIRSRRIMGVFRRVLQNNIIGSSTWFYLNKQVAYAGTVSICEEEAESPLGPIKVSITSSRLEAVIEWLIQL